MSNPVLTRELRTGLRGHRAFFLRTAFVTVLAAVVIITWMSALASMGAGGWRQASLDVRAIPGLGRELFAALGTALLVLLLALIPGYAAGAISGERETRTLEMMLCTWLKPRHIVLGKLSASTVFAVGLILSSLPAVSAVFLLGGVSPLEVGLLFVLLLTTAIFVAALSLFVSGFCTKTYMAIMVTYLLIGLLHYAGPLGARAGLWAIQLAPGDQSLSRVFPEPIVPSHHVPRFVNPVFTSQSLFGGELTDVVGAGSAVRVRARTLSGTSERLRFALVHCVSPAAMLLGTLVLVLITNWVVGRSTDVVGPSLTQRIARRLTGRARRQAAQTRAAETEGPAATKSVRRRSATWQRIADRVNNPVLARDLRGRPLGSADIILRAGLYGFVVTEVILLAAATRALADPGSGAIFLYGEFVARAMAIAVVVVAFLAAIPAAMSIAVEKEQRTLEMMLTTLLRPRSILWGKLAAAFWQAQPLILLGAPIGVLSAALDVVPWSSAAYMLVCLEAFALAACSLGVLASLLARRPARAVSATLCIIAGLAIGPMLLFRLGITGIFGIGIAHPRGAWLGPLSALNTIFTAPHDHGELAFATTSWALRIALLAFLTALVLFKRTTRQMIESA